MPTMPTTHAIGFKGAVSRYSVIFCAFFAQAKNGGCSRKCRGHQTSKLGRPRGLPAWPRHPRWLLTWQCREPTTSRARVALLHLSTATDSAFVFRLRGPCKVISPSSRFEISSDSCIDIDSLFSCLVLRAFRSLLWRSRRREHGWLGEGIGGVVVAPFPVTLTVCVTVKANALNEERVRETDVDVRADTGFVLAFAQYMTKIWRLKKRTCGMLWGRPGRRPRTFEGDAQGPCMSSVQLLSARRCTFEHCTSCCPSRDATMVVLTKKKNAKRRLPLHEKDLLRVGANVGSEMFSQVLVWPRIEWVHQSANDKTTTWPPAAGSAWKSCFDQLGHDRSAVIIQRCAACPWISAIFPGGRHYFSPHKMAKKNHWLSWHSRFKFSMSKTCRRLRSG